MNVKIFVDQTSKFSLQIGIDKISEIKSLCLASPRIETGGILIGKYNANLNRALVMKIEGPPEDSIFEKTWFYRGVKGIKEKLTKIWATEKLYYLGEWHYHPYSSPSPSEEDHSYMKGISSNPKVDCSSPILFILGGNPESEDDKISVTVYNNKKPIELLLKT